MRRTTKHVPGDRIALSALWFVFPARLIAESTTCALYGGGGLYKFRPEYIIDQGYYNNQYRVPGKEYKDFQAFQRREVAKVILITGFWT